LPDSLRERDIFGVTGLGDAVVEGIITEILSGGRYRVDRLNHLVNIDAWI
jgi:hypothetical protein